MWGGNRADWAGAMDSLLLWWRDAGVGDCVGDRPSPWVERACPPGARQAPAAEAQPFPSDLPQFLARLRGEDQPEARWPGPFIPPRLVEGAPLLVLTDLPDDSATGERMNATHQSLLAAMLRAIGLAPEAVSLATLATRRPAGGLLDEDSGARLAARARHLLQLAAPRAVLLLGDQTARLLSATDGGGAAHPLRSVNHSQGTLPAVTLPHLLLLAQKPRLKARSWAALRHLKERIDG